MSLEMGWDSRMDAQGQSIDQPICGFDFTIGRARLALEIAMPRFAPGSARTIGASLGLGLILAWKYSNGAGAWEDRGPRPHGPLWWAAWSQERAERIEAEADT